MARNNFVKCLAVTLPHEGGWADHPKDPGGATMKGVTLATFRKWVKNATKADLRDISDDWVEEIYRTGYWDAVSAESLRPGVDLAVFDAAVNSGPSRSAKWLQSCVGSAQDGRVGKITINAALSTPAPDLVKKLCAKRLGFVQGLKIFSTFGKGWSRRIADIEAKGVAMAMAGLGVRDDFVRDAMADASDEALGKAKSQDKAAITTAGGGAAGGGAATAGADVNLWVMLGVAVFVVAAVVAIKSRSRINKDRADAYNEVAISD